ncbi:Uncharacterized protein FWK35_00023637, partial [Aphis craccivora]
HGTYRGKNNKYVVTDGLLRIHLNDNTPVVIPHTKTQNVIWTYHDHKNDIRLYVKSCHICACTKTTARRCSAERRTYRRRKQTGPGALGGTYHQRSCRDRPRFPRPHANPARPPSPDGNTDSTANVRTPGTTTGSSKQDTADNSYASDDTSGNTSGNNNNNRNSRKEGRKGGASQQFRLQKPTPPDTQPTPTNQPQDVPAPSVAEAQAPEVEILTGTAETSEQPTASLTTPEDMEISPEEEEELLALTDVGPPEDGDKEFVYDNAIRGYLNTPPKPPPQISTSDNHHHANHPIATGRKPAVPGGLGWGSMTRPARRRTTPTRNNRARNERTADPRTGPRLRHSSDPRLTTPPSLFTLIHSFHRTITFFVFFSLFTLHHIHIQNSTPSLQQGGGEVLATQEKCWP